MKPINKYLKGVRLLLLQAALVLTSISPIHASDQDFTSTFNGAVDTPLTIEENQTENQEVTSKLKQSNASYLAPYQALYDQGERQSLGVIGYFLALGKNDAAAIVAKGIAENRLSLEEKGSAASLDNILVSMEIAKTTNQLRKQHHLPALFIDPQLMAIAIVQASTSRGSIFHSQLYPVTENLAWGFDPTSPMTSGDNPFDIWYEAERLIHEAGGGDDKTGHYRNIVAESSRYTGVSFLNTADSYFGRVSAQVFSNKSWDESFWTPDEVIASIDVFQKSGTAVAPDQIITSSASQDKVVMHRLYNPNSGEHFYTASQNERNVLIRAGWTYEGNGWVAPALSDIPVYRLYNENAGDHHYTTDANERNTLINVGWKDEGIGWYSALSDGMPVYRQYNPNAQTGSHNFTTDEKEHNDLGALGWHLEGVAWYAAN